MIDYNAPWWPHSPPSGTDATLLCAPSPNGGSTDKRIHPVEVRGHAARPPGVWG